MNNPGFFKLLFAPFFRWWWAVLTGVMSILSFYGVSNSGLVVPKGWVGFIVFVSLTLLFAAVSAIYQSWNLFKHRDSNIVVDSFYKVEDQDHAYSVILSGYLEEGVGTILPIYRKHRGSEVLFAVIKIERVTTSGQYQGVPFWISSGSLRDFKKRTFSERELIVKRHVVMDTNLSEAFTNV